MKFFLDPPLSRTEWAVIAIAALAALIAGYAFGKVVFG